MISLRCTFRNTAALCALLTVGVSVAEDGVVRMSDRGVNPSGSAIQKALHSSGPCAESCYVPQECYMVPGCNTCDPCDGGMCYSGGCDNGMCNSCYTPMDCNSCFSGCDNSGMGGWGNGCQNCQGHNGRGRGRGMNDQCNDGRQAGFLQKCKNANNRACDRLFGWMVPSGNCGQGSPWFGKYHMTYADQPSYIDPRDTQLYAAQGYNMPITVPLAPTVNHSYNYSSGLPASRVTQIGNYNPISSPRPLKCQTW